MLEPGWRDGRKKKAIYKLTPCSLALTVRQEVTPCQMNTGPLTWTGIMRDVRQQTGKIRVDRNTHLLELMSLEEEEAMENPMVLASV
jgi:hypothetical protein